MGNETAGQRPCDADDLHGVAHGQTVRRDRGRRREQIQRGFLRFTGGLFFALASLAFAEESVHYSHKQHAPLKIECNYCHTTVETGEKASFPAAAKCMACHRAVKKDSPEIRRLAALGADTTLSPANQVYAVQDFVIFSHARHHKAGIDCRNCHGVVNERHVIATPEVPITMKGCVDCHRSHGASLTCNACHELGQ